MSSKNKVSDFAVVGLTFDDTSKKFTKSSISSQQFVAGIFLGIWTEKSKKYRSDFIAVLTKENEVIFCNYDHYDITVFNAYNANRKTSYNTFSSAIKSQEDGYQELMSFLTKLDDIGLLLKDTFLIDTDRLVLPDTVQLPSRSKSVFNHVRFDNYKGNGVHLPNKNPLPNNNISRIPFRQVERKPEVTVITRRAPLLTAEERRERFSTA